jgi:hypothetical protein
MIRLIRNFVVGLVIGLGLGLAVACALAGAALLGVMPL